MNNNTKEINAQLKLMGDVVQTETTIECTKCLTGSAYCDIESAAIEYFYEDGWRVTKDGVYCPTCVNKYNLLK